MILNLTLQGHSRSNVTTPLDSPYMISCYWFNSNLWPNSGPFRNIRLWDLSDLDIDLSRSLRVKFDGSIGLLIYGFLLMFNSSSSIRPNLAPLWNGRLQNLSDFEFDLPKEDRLGVVYISLGRRAFVSKLSGIWLNIWSKGMVPLYVSIAISTAVFKQSRCPWASALRYCLIRAGHIRTKVARCATR